MSNQLRAIRYLRDQEKRALDVYRERYDRLVSEGKHPQAAVVRGQITRQCGKLDGIDQILEAIK